VRSVIARASGDELRLLEHLRQHGESMADDVELELGWTRRRLKSVRDRLERFGAVISDGLVFDEAGGWHFAPMRRWDAVVPKAPASKDPVGDVIVAAVRAAVIAPEREVRSWFGWPVTTETIDRLVEAGAFYRTATADTTTRSLYVR